MLAAPAEPLPQVWTLAVSTQRSEGGLQAAGLSTFVLGASVADILTCPSRRRRRLLGEGGFESPESCQVKLRETGPQGEGPACQRLLLWMARLHMWAEGTAPGYISATSLPAGPLVRELLWWRERQMAHENQQHWLAPFTSGGYILASYLPYLFSSFGTWG